MRPAFLFRSPRLKPCDTFHKDGTLSAWFQNSTITTTRSPNHGLWRRDEGWSAYSFKFVHLRYNLATGLFIGRQEAAGTLVLGESGDEFTTDGSTALFDANGNATGGGLLQFRRDEIQAGTVNIDAADALQRSPIVRRVA